MKWTKVDFGKYEGKTLPQIILCDPDWFFWGIKKEIFKGKLIHEADDLAARATSIKIPKRNPHRWEAEYRLDEEFKFCSLAFVRVSEPAYGRYVRLGFVNLSFVWRDKAYDKKRCRRLIAAFKRHYFGEKRLTKRRCEQFFSDDANFGCCDEKE